MSILSQLKSYLNTKRAFLLHLKLFDRFKTLFEFTKSPKILLLLDRFKTYSNILNVVSHFYVSN